MGRCNGRSRQRLIEIYRCHFSFEGGSGELGLVILSDMVLRSAYRACSLSPGSLADGLILLPWCFYCVIDFLFYHKMSRIN